MATIINTVSYVIDGDTATMSHFMSYLDMVDDTAKIVGVTTAFNTEMWSVLPVGKSIVTVRATERTHDKVYNAFPVVTTMVFRAERMV